MVAAPLAGSTRHACLDWMQSSLIHCHADFHACMWVAIHASCWGEVKLV